MREKSPRGLEAETRPESSHMFLANLIICLIGRWCHPVALVLGVTVAMIGKTDFGTRKGGLRWTK